MRILSKNIPESGLPSLPSYHPPHCQPALGCHCLSLDYYSNLLTSLPASMPVPPQPALSTAARGIQLMH